jgi:Skp family chaperone for outer membrane proteins
MKFKTTAAAIALLAATFAVPQVKAQDSGAAPQAKRHKKATQPPQPSVEEQIERLRLQMQTQIDTLKTNLADKDAQLRQAQQAATDAQAAAAKAQAAVDAQQQEFTQNAAAVSTLQGTVSDLKANQTSLADTVSTETANVKKMVTSPDALYYKGITISPAGSFLAGETVWRSAATGDGINTSFTGVPLTNADEAQLSEFQGSGRQSRLALRATGKLDNMTLTGYYEGDWLGAGITSNNNQSNSYVFRQRQLWADAALNNGWDFSAGQGWSLATETTQGLTRGTEILPATIDPQYEAGFVWTRQYSFRVSKSVGNKFFIGASAENAETLNPTGNGIPLNEVIGSAGVNGGLYNVTANYSFNYNPDLIAKIAIEPGWGHWEIFGIERTFRDRIYPNETCTSTTVSSGLTTTTCTGNTTGAYNDKEIGGGIGGGFRAPLASKKITIGLKGLWGQGMGRYGSSTIADVTIRPDGQLSPIHGFSALSTVELNPTPRLNIYFNYGGDYLDRDYVLNASGTQVGYGARSVNMSGCNTEPVNGGTSNTYGGGGTGFLPTAPSNCGANNKDVQEFTAGWWYNIYAGPKGRLRQGLQYSYIRRDLWSGAGGTANPGGGADGTDNMVFTSFRYYLP